MAVSKTAITSPAANSAQPNKEKSFRKLWIQRINAACRVNGLSYSRFMNGLKKANIALDRKVLSDIAITDPKGFAALCEQAKSAL